ncbi:MAG: stage III sporulation protein AB [Clostridiales bacterium]|nr:stage III sporulation protein AB [Clostridiales bacterium]
MGLQLIGSMFIIIGTSLLGFWWAANYKKRVEALDQIAYLMRMLYGEIKYQEGNFAESFLSMGRHCSGRSQSFCMDLAQALEEGSGQPFHTIWRNMVDTYWRESALLEEDRTIFITLGENLGYLDKEMQLNTIQLFIHQIDQRKQQLQQTMPEKCRISRLIGVLAGVFITIMLL